MEVDGAKFSLGAKSCLQKVARRGRLGVELAQVLDVLGVGDRDAVLRLEPCIARPGDVHNSVGPFPHWRELVETFPGEDSPQDKVPCFESARADVAAVVAAEILLVPCRSQGHIAAEPFEQQQVVVAQLVQLSLLEGQDSRRAMGDLAGRIASAP